MRTWRLFSSARSGQTYSTDRPDQFCSSIADSSGRTAASVLPRGGWRDSDDVHAVEQRSDRRLLQRTQ